MSRPARAKPTRSLRWSMEVEPSCDRTTNSIARGRYSSSSSSTPPAAARRGLLAFDSIDIARTALAAPVGDDGLDLVLTHPRALDPPRDARGRREQQEVAPADEALGAGLVEDDTAVGERRDREGEPRGDVRLDDAGDHVDRRPLGGDDEVDPHRPRHLRDPADRLLDVARGDHHQVVQLVHHDEDERQPDMTGARAWLRPAGTGTGHDRRRDQVGACQPGIALRRPRRPRRCREIGLAEIALVGELDIVEIGRPARPASIEVGLVDKIAPSGIAPRRGRARRAARSPVVRARRPDIGPRAAPPSSSPRSTAAL